MINPKRDQGHKAVDKRLEVLESRLKKEYIKASVEVEAKLNDYLKRFEAKDAYKSKLVDEGALKKSEYLNWRKGQIAIGHRWEELKDSLAKDLANTNKIAKSMIDNHIKDVYALSHNYGTFEVEKGECFGLIGTSL